MLNVYLTIDVEIWSDGWEDIDKKFSSAFHSYIYGQTRRGSYGLPYQLDLLNDHDLTAVFLVEPLFALRFGMDPLSEVTGLIMDAGQPVELHMHTEWVDEAITPPLPDIQHKRQHLKYFSQEEQTTLIGLGKDLLNKAGVPHINAFRAGSFGFDLNTLSALRENKIFIDSSYNATQMGRSSGLRPEQVLTSTIIHEGVHEVPMTVFSDRPGHLRHVQLCACSWREMEGLLWKAHDEGRQEFVILSHNFELLDRSRTRANSVVVDRMRKLCAFLEKNSDSFSTRGFGDFSSEVSPEQLPPLTSPTWKTGLRMLEQAWSKYR